MNPNSSIPWIEKYRPEVFDDIVLDPTNRQFFRNILDHHYFPNLLFYGPPGTGKTTTILNLINDFKKTDKSSLVYAQSARPSSGKHHENVIHLNASDERGIDIIRNQINQFVKSNHLFETGLKFVVLDEVDYMTKNAQQALKTLLQTCRPTVRFCLICNYISKIDESLQNEFVCVRFNQLPQKEIHRFIQNIVEKESLDLNESEIETIQVNYNSDIRSMINFIQLHATSSVVNTYTPPEKASSTATNSSTHSDMKFEDKSLSLSSQKGSEVFSGDELSSKDNIRIQMNIIHKENWKTIHRMLMPKKKLTKQEFIQLPKDSVEQYIHKLSIKYNTDKRNILNSYFNYVIRHFPEVISEEFLHIIENATHNNDNVPITYILMYLCANLSDYYAKC